MINSHKELVNEIKIFSEKMELINEFQYLKDVDDIEKVLINSEPRLFAIGLASMRIEEEDYNMTLTYRYALLDEVLHDTDSILNSETENIFVVSALHDYLNYIKDVNVDILDVDFSTEADADSTYCSVYGQFEFTIKRSASYWKKMETYSTN